jgi:hypothetical protein
MRIHEQLVDTIADEIIETLSAANIPLSDIAVALLEVEAAAPAIQAMKDAFQNQGYSAEGDQMDGLIRSLVHKPMPANVAAQILATKRDSGDTQNNQIPTLDWFIHPEK